MGGLDIPGRDDDDVMMMRWVDGAMIMTSCVDVCVCDDVSQTQQSPAPATHGWRRTPTHTRRGWGGSVKVCARVLVMWWRRIGPKHNKSPTPCHARVLSTVTRRG